jgi:endonuclease/exonuclease/phosphatase family metal-dependent hydrolase
MKLKIWLCALVLQLLAGLLHGREFTVLVYNVENLFDVDGVALFGQYEQTGSDDAYGPGPLLNKLESIRRTLAAVNSGRGPEVILFQEFELDRTPYGTPDAAAFIARNRDRPLAQLLEESSWARRLPAELLLLKYLTDHGMAPYHIAQPDPARMESHPPHKNVVFSRFPVTFVRQRAKLDARDLLVVGLDVDGRELIVLNNHWKSGASNPELEPVRVQNARVVRAEVEAILTENPLADVIVAGDFNAYYNHSAAFPELEETAVNDVLRANGWESRMVEAGSRNLYNLWFELPREQRGSEVWQGRWGTLMQMVVTPGLYDQRGIQYVDNSFGRLILPGENVETRWGRPIAWTNHGGGAGFSDHLPIYARFQVVEDERDGWMQLQRPTNEAPDAFRPVVPFARMDRRAVPPIEELATMSPAERARQFGSLFRVDTELAGSDPAVIQVGELELEVFSPVRSVREVLSGMAVGDPLRAFVDLDDWRGRLQVVIRDPAWLHQPAIPAGAR